MVRLGGFQIKRLSKAKQRGRKASDPFREV